jgi:hypothetical protein
MGYISRHLYGVHGVYRSEPPFAVGRCYVVAHYSCPLHFCCSLTLRLHSTETCRPGTQGVLLTSATWYVRETINLCDVAIQATPDSYHEPRFLRSCQINSSPKPENSTQIYLGTYPKSRPWWPHLGASKVMFGDNVAVCSRFSLCFSSTATECFKHTARLQYLHPTFRCGTLPAAVT